jgi:hypothetical protein
MEYTSTFTIDLINSDALSLLLDMERMGLIRVTPPEETAPVPEAGFSKPSARFAGALHLSPEKHAAFQTALREGREEWERDIY